MINDNESLPEQPGPLVAPFAALMQRELDTNAVRKGDGGWLHADPEALLHDITWHWAKLAVALRTRRDMERLGGDLAPANEQVIEYAADVANMAAMLLDRLGLLAERAKNRKESDN